jgi:glucokinase
VDLGGTSPTAAVANAATGDQAQCYLGLAVAGCVNLLDPEPVVLGGGVLERMGEAYVERVRVTAQDHYVNRNDLARVRIVRASLGDSSGAIGAAVLASRRLA